MLGRRSLAKQGLNGIHKTSRRLNRLPRLLPRHVFGDPIITNATQFKQLVQRLTVLSVQLVRLDESLVNGSNHATVLAQFQPFWQQEGRGSIKGRIIRS